MSATATGNDTQRNVPVDVSVGGKYLRVYFDPLEMTPSLRKRLMSEDTSGDYTAMAEIVSEIVTAWDLKGANGEALPLSPASIESLPLPDLTAIFYGLYGAVKSQDAGFTPWVPQPFPCETFPSLFSSDLTPRRMLRQPRFSRPLRRVYLRRNVTVRLSTSPALSRSERGSNP